MRLARHRLLPVDNTDRAADEPAQCDPAANAPTVPADHPKPNPGLTDLATADVAADVAANGDPAANVPIVPADHPKPNPGHTDLATADFAADEPANGGPAANAPTGPAAADVEPDRGLGRG